MYKAIKFSHIQRKIHNTKSNLNRQLKKESHWCIWRKLLWKGRHGGRNYWVFW